MTTNRALLALLAAALLPLALLVLEMTWAIPSHDRQLRQLARRYEAVRHSPGSYAVYLYDGPHDPAGDWRCT